MHLSSFDKQQTFPIGSEKIQRVFVDDIITGGNSNEEDREIMGQVQHLLSKSKFKLRKWCSNIPDVLHGIPAEDMEHDITKTLDLTFNSASDRLLFSYSQKIKLAGH